MVGRPHFYPAALLAVCLLTAHAAAVAAAASSPAARSSAVLCNKDTASGAACGRAYRIDSVAGRDDALVKLERTPWWGGWDAAKRAASALGSPTPAGDAAAGTTPPRSCVGPVFAVSALRGAGRTYIFGVCWEAVSRRTCAGVGGVRSVAWPSPAGLRFATGRLVAYHSEC